jgi:hypothetical protein
MSFVPTVLTLTAEIARPPASEPGASDPPRPTVLVCRGGFRDIPRQHPEGR